MDPRGGRGTSADIVPTHIKLGVDPSTRCWDIAQKPPKCKNSPLTPISKMSFPLFPLPPPGTANTQKGRIHIRNQSTPACKLWRESARVLSRNRWQKSEQRKKTYSKTNTSPFALTSESIIINRSLSVTLLFLWVSAKLFCFELSEALTRGQD